MLEAKMANINDLWKAWCNIRQCMDNYGELYPPGREIAVRYALIDPILRALDWDLSNPEYVRLEWTQARGLRPDYTFLKDGNPVLYVEAKGWGNISP
jgi:predicted type IV restriction endonuclease